MIYHSVRCGDLRRWHVGLDRVELAPDGCGWTARVVRSDWGGTSLKVDCLFTSEPEALAWCERMAAVLAEDLRDDEQK